MLRWYGDRVKRKIRAYSRESINETMDAAVRHARSNHPGWKSISGRAEQSIRIITPAQEKPRKVLGRWGSTGVPYMLKLEFVHGRALINAADAVYGKLTEGIRKRWRFSSGRGRR